MSLKHQARAYLSGRAHNDSVIATKERTCLAVKEINAFLFYPDVRKSPQGARHFDGNFLTDELVELLVGRQACDVSIEIAVLEGSDAGFVEPIVHTLKPDTPSQKHSAHTSA